MYYLLKVGEYTVKKYRNNPEKTTKIQNEGRVVFFFQRRQAWIAEEIGRKCKRQVNHDGWRFSIEDRKPKEWVGKREYFPRGKQQTVHVPSQVPRQEVLLQSMLWRQGHVPVGLVGRWRVNWRDIPGHEDAREGRTHRAKKSDRIWH